MSKEITFKFNEDCHCFKKGTTKKITINDQGLVWLVGENKSGKSTLLQLMRSRKNALKDKKNRVGNDIMSISIQMMNTADVEIDGLDQYDNIMYLDSIIDDPVSMENSASAGSYIDGGGYALQRQSKGEKALTMMSMFMQNIDTTIGQNNGHNLIVFDEVDEGFDIIRQTKFYGALKIFKEHYNADIICVSHSIIPIIMSDVHDVYSLTSETYIDLQDYISWLSNMKVSIKVEEITNKEMIDIITRVYNLDPLPDNTENKDIH